MGQKHQAGRAAGYARRGQHWYDHCAAPTDVTLPLGAIPRAGRVPSAGESATPHAARGEPPLAARPHCASQSQGRARRPLAHAPVNIGPQFVSAPKSGGSGHFSLEQVVPGPGLSAGKRPRDPIHLPYLFSHTLATLRLVTSVDVPSLNLLWSSRAGGLCPAQHA
jgi:hypothetical protein